MGKRTSLTVIVKVDPVAPAATGILSKDSRQGEHEYRKVIGVQSRVKTTSLGTTWIGK
jgi:hypothetical protein